MARLGNGEFSEEDWNRWKTRSLDLLPQHERNAFLDTAILACAYKKDSFEHNVRRVKNNGTPIAPITAESVPREANRQSSDRASGLPRKIILNRNTVFRLTSNLWTAAGLTNGAIGIVKAIIYAPGKKPPALPTAIIATFDSYVGPPWREDIPKSVVITPVKREWFSHQTKCHRTMLPIVLGYALSIHKLQGSTCDRIILNAGKKEYVSGIMLVGASRVKLFDNLALHPFPNFERFEQVNNNRSVRKQKIEETRMRELQQLTIEKYELSNAH